MEFGICYAVRSVLEMIGYFATAIAVIISTIAICYTHKAYKLQKVGILSNNFHAIYDRLTRVLDQIPAKSDSDIQIQNWYTDLFNAFDSMLYLTKHDIVTKELASYYHSSIIMYIRNVRREFPDIAEKLRGRPHPQFRYVRDFFRDETGEECPI